MQLRAALPLVAFSLFVSARPLAAQDPALALDNLKASRRFSTGQYVFAFCSLETGKDKFVKFRYDRHGALERLSVTGGPFTRKKGGSWMKSDDWGKTGVQVVDVMNVAELDSWVRIANLPFDESALQDLDPGQGGAVWRALYRTKGELSELFTYERYREKPMKTGYPTFTFIKYQADKDGELLLHDFQARVKYGGRVVPLAIRFEYALRFAGH